METLRKLSRLRLVSSSLVYVLDLEFYWSICADYSQITLLFIYLSCPRMVLMARKHSN
jgi:hypothetical protein